MKAMVMVARAGSEFSFIFSLDILWPAWIYLASSCPSSRKSAHLFLIFMRHLFCALVGDDLDKETIATRTWRGPALLLRWRAADRNHDNGITG